jgi:hypothetical protein
VTDVCVKREGNKGEHNEKMPIFECFNIKKYFSSRIRVWLKIKFFRLRLIFWQRPLVWLINHFSCALETLLNVCLAWDIKSYVRSRKKKLYFFRFALLDDALKVNAVVWAIKIFGTRDDDAREYLIIEFLNSCLLLDQRIQARAKSSLNCCFTKTKNR